MYFPYQVLKGNVIVKFLRFLCCVGYDTLMYGTQVIGKLSRLMVAVQRTETLEEYFSILGNTRPC